MSKNTENQPKTLVVVLGMHRSGTSAVAKSLQVLGVDLGDCLEPPAQDINAKGYWEDIDIVRLNEQMLAACNLQWHSLKAFTEHDADFLCQQGFLLEATAMLRTKMQNIQCFGFKDPRTAKLLPFWQRVFAATQFEVKYVVAYRNPLSVADSLAKRDGFARAKSFLLVLDYLSSCFDVLQTAQSAFIDYDALMHMPMQQLEHLAQQLNFSIDAQEAEIYCREFIDSSLRHSHYDKADLALAPEAISLIKEIHEFFLDDNLVEKVRVSKERIELWQQELKRWRAVLAFLDELHSEVSQITLMVHERDARILNEIDRNHELSGQVSDVQKEVESAHAQLQEQNEYLVRLTHDLEAREKWLEEVTAQLNTSNDELQLREKWLEEVTTQLNASNDELQLREKWLEEVTTQLNISNNELQQHIHWLHEKDAYIEQAQGILHEKELYILALEHEVQSLTTMKEELLGSTSWRVTAPVRFLGRITQFAKRLIWVAPKVVWKKGLIKSLKAGYRVWRTAGLLGIRAHLVALERQQSIHFQASEENAPKTDLNIVPLYVDPDLASQQLDTASLPKQRVAVHLHLFYLDLLDEMLERLRLIPQEFDLFISIANKKDVKQVQKQVQAAQTKVQQLVIEAVPNRGRNFGPLIVQFGERLAQYDVVGHFHSKKSPHNEKLADWCSQILNDLLGKPNDTAARIGYYFEQLAGGTKFIYPAGRLEFIKHPSGWDDNYEKSRLLLERFTDISIDHYPQVEFPEGAMWWARGDALHQLLTLPLKFNDFEAEPIGADGSLAHALERLVFILSAHQPGPLLRIEHGDSVTDYSWYETQQDFSDKIVHQDIKVLSYYLPQFHYTPENNEWHGDNFTEWTKVSAANPLFFGHYQQHIPHKDIGYYLLDKPETLKRQAEQMRQAGVHGQIFYHYWFTGRMILEKPAQMLLENKDIDMPFCFCWANENWTRRWDGNESEILLGQDYSAEDAKGFIQYLIPFFKDERYIRVDGRPVLMVYRPSSIPDPKQYQEVWAQECEAAGLKAPYMVAVLTRGATSPNDFGMDAGTERALHDWTAGNAPEIKQSLHAYRPINGTVIHYKDVANYYMGQQQAKDFTYFRNLVPQWDNTARYGSEAYVVHGSTPQMFQDWFKNMVAYSQKHLPADRRFVIINAWNEWAEGAHLEPDNRYGYSYLNSIGRVLSDMELASRMDVHTHLIPSDLKLHVVLPPHLINLLKEDKQLAEDYLYGLKNSLSALECQVSINPEAQEYLPGFTLGVVSDADYCLELRVLSFFAQNVIQQLLAAALANKDSAVIANVYGNHELLKVQDNSCVSLDKLYDAPLIIKSAAQKELGNVFVCTQAKVFAHRPSLLAAKKHPVTTVMRVHAKADLKHLHNALGCLAAMRDCISVPLITAQGFDEAKTAELDSILQQYNFAKKNAQVMHFAAQEGQDLRSKMLNEGLLAVKTQYAAFLDYDDFVFNDAYAWLIERLHKTRKAVAFGRVYATSYETTTGRFLQRSRTYEYGGSYSEFVRLNHAPLHSFLLDVKKIDLSKIKYFDEQKYMEDYYLTLQLFTEENSDWEGLSLNRYVGDYIHSVDSGHTLAFVNDEEREQLLRGAEYQECEERIHQLRCSL